MKMLKVYRTALRVVVYTGVILTAVYILRPHRYVASRGAPVSRAKSDMRSLATAIESYFVDYGVYPASSVLGSANHPETTTLPPNGDLPIPTFRLRLPGSSEFETLTTPISYITQYFTDPFAPSRGDTYAYWVWQYQDGPEKGETPGWILWSPGPDRDYDITAANVASLYSPFDILPGNGSPFYLVPSNALLERTYDPTNGSTSDGDVYRFKQ